MDFGANYQGFSDNIRNLQNSLQEAVRAKDGQRIAVVSDMLQDAYRMREMQEAGIVKPPISQNAATYDNSGYGSAGGSAGTSSTGQYNINIKTDEVIDTVNRGVNPNLENIRDYVDKIPGIISLLASACKCDATYAAVDGMSAFRNKVSNHVENTATTGKVMVDIAQTHSDLDAKLANMSYH